MFRCASLDTCQGQIGVKFHPESAPAWQMRADLAGSKLSSVKPSPPMSSHLLSKKQVAVILGVSERTITRWDREGRFGRVQLTDRTVRYHEHEIHKLVEDANRKSFFTGQRNADPGKANA